MKPIVICGPTASGKTDLALELAHQTNGVIISADSRQVYQHLTIGTAKPQGSYQQGIYTVDGIAYLLVDFLDVTAQFNVGDFCKQATALAAQYEGRQLIFAGGTGMYLHAYFVGMDDLPPSTPQTRTQLNTLLQTQGKEGLHQALQAKDPISAAQIPIGNVQRTMRALELCLLTGKPASTLKSGQFFKLPNPQESHWVILDWDKDALHARIAKRTEQIFDGMAEEARKLLAQGFSSDIPALKTLGYPQAIAYLQGTRSRIQSIQTVALKTRQYAKRQCTWFNRYTQAQRVCLSAPQEFNPQKIAQDIISCAH